MTIATLAWEEVLARIQETDMVEKVGLCSSVLEVTEKLSRRVYKRATLFRKHPREGSTSFLKAGFDGFGAVL